MQPCLHLTFWFSSAESFVSRWWYGEKSFSFCFKNYFSDVGVRFLERGVCDFKMCLFLVVESFNPVGL